MCLFASARDPARRNVDQDFHQNDKSQKVEEHYLQYVYHQQATVLKRDLLQVVVWVAGRRNILLIFTQGM
jgi:hypothetical protein